MRVLPLLTSCLRIVAVCEAWQVLRGGLRRADDDVVCVRVCECVFVCMTHTMRWCAALVVTAAKGKAMRHTHTLRTSDCANKVQCVLGMCVSCPLPVPMSSPLVSIASMLSV